MRVTREEWGQLKLAAAYAALSLLSTIVCFEHMRRSRGARHGRWQPGRWVPR